MCISQTSTLFISLTCHPDNGLNSSHLSFP
uniref:Uncharacterized protein n=1 Tax=Arundo donax TaxID=35708 RepID=A0A0A9BVJ6_ARUDO